MLWFKKLICKLIGHDWNHYAVGSSYRKNYCNRCKVEKQK